MSYSQKQGRRESILEQGARLKAERNKQTSGSVIVNSEPLVSVVDGKKVRRSKTILTFGTGMGSGASVNRPNAYGIGVS